MCIIPASRWLSLGRLGRQENTEVILKTVFFLTRQRQKLLVKRKLPKTRKHAISQMKKWKLCNFIFRSIIKKTCKLHGKKALPNRKINSDFDNFEFHNCPFDVACSGPAIKNQVCIELESIIDYTNEQGKHVEAFRKEGKGKEREKEGKTKLTATWLNHAFFSNEMSIPIGKMKRKWQRRHLMKSSWEPRWRLVLAIGIHDCV